MHHKGDLAADGINPSNLSVTETKSLASCSYFFYQFPIKFSVMKWLTRKPPPLDLETPR
jgi:hypothetical protein